MEVRYCICKHCGNIVEKVKDKGVPVICCGEPMQELKAGGQMLLLRSMYLYIR